MRINLFLISIVVVSVGAVEKFCDRGRKLLLAGVFNYENILFAYSWKDVNDFQQQIVWRFQISDKQLVEIGKSLTVEQVFPGIPLFRAGFGLSLKCDTNDDKCISYNKLVFVFFQTNYKVFRFINDRFADEPNADNIPWGLQTRGDVKEFGFGNQALDTVYGAAFMSFQIFIVCKDTLYSSPIDIKVSSLKWTKLTESKILSGVLGAFASAEDLIFNRNESPDGMVLIYDRNGKETKNTTVWSYFGCKVTDETFESQAMAESNSQQKKGDSKNRKEQEEANNTYAAIIITIIIIAIIISNTSAAIFWLSADKFRRKGKLANPS